MRLSHRLPTTAMAPIETVRPTDTLRVHLDYLEGRLRHNEPLPLAALQRLRDCLETVPCSTQEYSRAINHLINATGYYRRREHGAARYELLMLLREVRPLASDA